MAGPNNNFHIQYLEHVRTDRHKYTVRKCKHFIHPGRTKVRTYSNRHINLLQRLIFIYWVSFLGFQDFNTHNKPLLQLSSNKNCHDLTKKSISHVWVTSLRLSPKLYQIILDFCKISSSDVLK